MKQGVVRESGQAVAGMQGQHKVGGLVRGAAQPRGRNDDCFARYIREMDLSVAAKQGGAAFSCSDTVSFPTNKTWNTLPIMQILVDRRSKRE